MKTREQLLKTAPFGFYDCYLMVPAWKKRPKDKRAVRIKNPTSIEKELGFCYYIPAKKFIEQEYS